MKAVICVKCSDILAPRPSRGKMFCHCKATWAIAEDSGKLESCFKLTIGGQALPVAICTNHLRWAAINFNYDGRTSFIQCWSIDTTQEINDVVVESGNSEND